MGQDRFERSVIKSQERNEHKGGYNVVVGLGHSPAILRGSPHFQAVRTAAIDVLCDEGGDAQAREICGDGMLDVVLPPVVALPQKGVAGWTFDVLTQNLRDRSRQDIPRSSCRLALQRGQNNRDPR